MNLSARSPSIITDIVYFLGLPFLVNWELLLLIIILLLFHCEILFELAVVAPSHYHIGSILLISTHLAAEMMISKNLPPIFSRHFRNMKVCWLNKMKLIRKVIWPMDIKGLNSRHIAICAIAYRSGISVC